MLKEAMCAFKRVSLGSAIYHEALHTATLMETNRLSLYPIWEIVGDQMSLSGLAELEGFSPE